MSDIEQTSLLYYQSSDCSVQWGDFLKTLASELDAQMSAEENRAFFYVLGARLADRLSLPQADTLEALEQSINVQLRSIRWGWTRIRDIHSSLEIVHACAPMRQAFGDAAMSWSGGVLEGLYVQAGNAKHRSALRPDRPDAAAVHLQRRAASTSLSLIHISEPTRPY